MSQYQPYAQRQQQQGVSQTQAPQSRPHAPTIQQTTNLYNFILFLVLLEMSEMSETIKIKLFKKLFYSGQVLETAEEILSSMDNQTLPYSKI